MKKYSMIIGLSLSAAVAYAQDGLTSLLHAIDSNNTTLQALRGVTDATKLANLTGLNPDNPQVQVNHLNISPLANHTRTDFNITQTIDFPTAYAQRRRIARASNEKAELQLASQRVALHYEAAQCYVNWVYTQQLARQYKRRVDIAQQLADAYQRMFDAGEVSILERNKAKVNLINYTKTAELNEVEQHAWYAELVRLNGGKPLAIDEPKYPTSNIPADFNAWYAQSRSYNTAIATAERDIAISREQQRLSRSLALPAITAGYMYEEDVDVRFRGITMGVSIPLWQQKNTVKQAQLQTHAFEQAEADANTQFYHEQLRLYQRARQLASVVEELAALTADTSGEELLKRALDLGELSLLDYLMELTMYYEAIDRRMEAERDLHLALVGLYKWKR